MLAFQPFVQQSKRKNGFSVTETPHIRKRSRSGTYTGPEMMDLDEVVVEVKNYNLNTSKMFEKYNFTFQLLKCPKEASVRIEGPKMTIYGDQFFYKTITEVSEKMDAVLYHLLLQMISEIGTEVKYYF